MNFADVAKVPVDGREADIGDLVERLQFLHHRCADFRCADFAFRPLLERRFDAISDGFDRRWTDGTLSHALRRPAISFCRSNRSRDPFFLMTMYGISSMRS